MGIQSFFIRSYYTFKVSDNWSTIYGQQKSVSFNRFEYKINSLTNCRPQHDIDLAFLVFNIPSIIWYMKAQVGAHKVLYAYDTEHLILSHLIYKIGSARLKSS